MSAFLARPRSSFRLSIAVGACAWLGSDEASAQTSHQSIGRWSAAFTLSRWSVSTGASCLRICSTDCTASSTSVSVGVAPPPRAARPRLVGAGTIISGLTPARMEESRLWAFWAVVCISRKRTTAGKSSTFDEATVLATRLHTWQDGQSRRTS